MRRCIRSPLPDFRRSHFARRAGRRTTSSPRSAGAIAAPSANRSGSLSPTRAEHVIEQLGDAVALVLDAGPCEVGLESTIVSLAERPAEAASARRHFRRGDRSGARRKAGPRDEPAIQSSAPGMLASHYAPRLPLRLNVTSVAPGEALLAFGNAAIADAEHAVAMRNLSLVGRSRRGGGKSLRLSRRARALRRVRA